MLLHCLVLFNYSTDGVHHISLGGSCDSDFGLSGSHKWCFSHMATINLLVNFMLHAQSYLLLICVETLQNGSYLLKKITELHTRYETGNILL